MPLKWKHCVEGVSRKNSKWCRDRKYPRSTDPKGKKCYNPYAICSRFRNSYAKGERREKSRSKIHTGSRGGKYRLVNGRKVYV